MEGHVLLAASDLRVLARLGRAVRPLDLPVDAISVDEWEQAATHLREVTPLALVAELAAGEQDGIISLLADLRSQQSLAHIGVLLIAPAMDPGGEHAVLLHGADLCLGRHACAAGVVRENLVALVRVAAARVADVVSAGPLTLHRTEQRAWTPAGELDLTACQFELLRRLVEGAGSTIGHAQLLGYPDSRHFADPVNVCRVQVCHIRKQLGEHAGMIECVRGRGYALRVVHPDAGLGGSRRRVAAALRRPSPSGGPTARRKRRE